MDAPTISVQWVKRVYRVVRVCNDRVEEFSDNPENLLFSFPSHARREEVYALLCWSPFLEELLICNSDMHSVKNYSSETRAR